MRLAFFAASLLAAPSALAAVGPQVNIVVGQGAPALERRAAEELAGQLGKLYDADAKVVAAAPAEAPHVILVGNPQTNPEIAKLAGRWPQLSDQGHLLRSVEVGGRTALMIGGGSPVATYWAAAEFGQRLGIRPMLYGDLYPVAPAPFSLAGYDVVREPKLRSRAWRTIDALPIGPESWSLAEQRRMLGQLAKLKFNRVVLAVHPWQPFGHFEFQGVKKETGVLWYGQQFLVSGETAGRAAFGGAKVFENPDFAGCATYDQRLAAGQKLLRGVIDAAHELGMTVGLQVDPWQFPKEFAAVITDAQPVADSAGLAIRPGNTQPRADAALVGLVQAQLRGYLEAYPNLDALYLSVSDSPDWQERAAAAWKPLTAAAGNDSPLPQLSKQIDAAEHRELLVAIPRKSSGSGVLMNASAGRGGVLPEAWAMSLPTLVSTLDSEAADGFCLPSYGIGELDLPAYMLSRGSFGDVLKPQQALAELLTPVCGEEVFDRVQKATELIERATSLAAQNDQEIGWPVPEVILRHYSSAEPPPAWWGQARECYLNAMNEMYRANTRAREGGRSYTLYLARRCEFGFEFFNCLEAVHKAGLAKGKQDRETQAAELQKAIESLHGGLNALAAVARCQSDRGIIAALNAYGYRPLMKALEAVE